MGGCGGSTAQDRNPATDPSGSSPSDGGESGDGIAGAGRPSPPSTTPEGAAGGAGNAAGPEGSGGIPGEPSPLSPRAQACDDYLGLWKQRQSEREPGEPIPPEGAPAPCFECFRAQESACALPAGDCRPTTACVDRHCLCSPEQPIANSCSARDYPEDLCGCIETCAGENTSCATRWGDYISCVVRACAAACR